MSRCFPYPPPGCSGKRLYDEALIESVKRRRERENAKTEKKEKRRKKKEKAKLCAHKLEDASADYGAGQLERSDLTEEHEQPLDSDNPCNSTDCTQNINKRKRDSFFSKERICSTENTTRIGSCFSFKNEMQGLSWNFPALNPEDDDLEWLFGRNLRDRNCEKRFKSGSQVSSCGSQVFWPLAEYLAEADIYKLPYTIPF